MDAMGCGEQARLRPTRLERNRGIEISPATLRVACDGCRESRLVPFSCKRRGLCPSCLGRRMCDFAAHRRDHVMPRVPVRQWVWSVVLRALVGVVSRRLRRRARAHGICATASFMLSKIAHPI
jgi:hypothetical protein